MREGEPTRDRKNIDEYEREKLERTLKDIELTLALGKNYLAMVESADRQGIRLERETHFDRLRMPNELMGPGGKLYEGIMELQGMFMSGQTEIAHQMTQEQARDIKFTE
jgi:hypothetical protein